MAMQFAFIGCGLGLLGLLLAVIGVISLQPALRSLRWKPAQGVITLRQPDAGQTQGADSANAQNSPHLHYSPQFRYRYHVGERQFEGSRVAFHNQGTPERYQDGQQVTVYYDPTAPDRSVLRPGPGLAGYLPLGAGGLLFVLGLILGMIAYAVY